jgi:F0F1-type ATP synthase assembly protein I
MPDVVQTIIDVLSQILRVIGLGVLGAGIGWLSLDLIHKEAWQLQIAVFLGLVGLVIALSSVGAASLGAFAIGVAVAIFLWGIQKKKDVPTEK